MVLIIFDTHADILAERQGTALPETAQTVIETVAMGIAPEISHESGIIETVFVQRCACGLGLVADRRIEGRTFAQCH